MQKIKKNKNARFYLIALFVMFSCIHTPSKRDILSIPADSVVQTSSQCFLKDSVKMGIKWFWVETFLADKIEERFALNLQNLSGIPVMLDSVYEIGAWRNRDSTYTLLYRDTFNRPLSINKYSVLCDTLHPQVKDVFRAKSDYSEYLFTIRAWYEKGDSIKLAYHITEPDIWEENGTGTFNFDREETTDSIWTILHNPMLIDVGIDYNELMNKTYICTTKRPEGNGKD